MHHGNWTLVIALFDTNAVYINGHLNLTDVDIRRSESIIMYI